MGWLTAILLPKSQFPPLKDSYSKKPVQKMNMRILTNLLPVFLFTIKWINENPIRWFNSWPDHWLFLIFSEPQGFFVGHQDFKSFNCTWNICTNSERFSSNPKKSCLKLAPLQHPWTFRCLEPKNSSSKIGKFGKNIFWTKHTLHDF